MTQNLLPIDTESHISDPVTPSYLKVTQEGKVLAEDMPEVLARLDRLEKTLKMVSRRYTWEDKESSSGIQLAGTATVTRTGYLLAACPIPVGPNQMTIGYVLQDDQGKIYMLPAESVKQVQE